MVRITLALMLALATVGCASTWKKFAGTFHDAPAKPEVKCEWPEPIVFTVFDDPYTVCFSIDHHNVSNCFSIRELRKLASGLRAAN